MLKHRPYTPIDNSPGENSNDVSLSPERALLAEILMQAIREIIRIKEGSRSPDNHHGRLALLWLEDDSESSEGGFTFVQICGYLNLSPQEIRNVIKRKLLDTEFQKQVGCSLRGQEGFAWRRRVMKGSEGAE